MSMQVKSYSQNLEDVKALSYFMAGKDPIAQKTLLSVGENNGVDLSNAKLLIEMGFEAYLIEPGAICADLFLLHKDNPKVHIYNIGFGEEEAIMPFWESGAHVPNGSDRGLVSTLDKSELKRWPGVEFVERSIQVVRFDKWWQENDCPKFDMISIDAESYDLQILQQIDLKEVACKMLIIEWNGDPDLSNKFTTYCNSFGLYEIHRNAENIIFAL